MRGISFMDVLLFCWIFFLMEFLLYFEEPVDVIFWVPFILGYYMLLNKCYRKRSSWLGERYSLGADIEGPNTTRKEFTGKYITELERLREKHLDIPDALYRAMEISSIATNDTKTNAVSIATADDFVGASATSTATADDFVGASATSTATADDFVSASATSTATADDFVSASATADDFVKPSSTSKVTGYVIHAAAASKCSDKEFFNEKMFAPATQTVFLDKVGKQEVPAHQCSEKRSRDTSNDPEVMDMMNEMQDIISIVEDITEVACYDQINKPIVTRKDINLNLTAEPSTSFEKNFTLIDTELSSNNPTPSIQKVQKLHDVTNNTKQKLSIDNIPLEFIYPCIPIKH